MDTNIVIGAGEVFVDLLDEDLDTQGERHVGDSVSFALSAAEQRTQIFTGDGPKADKLVDIVTQREYGGTLVLHSQTRENLALLLGGSSATESDENTAVADELIAVTKGLWYQLGVSAEKRMGYLAVSAKNFNMSHDVNGTDTVLPADANYLVDAANGRVFIKPGAGITDGEEVKIDYTPIAGTHDRAQSVAGSDTLIAAIRYVESSAAGVGRNVYIRQCKLGAQGDFALKAGRQGEQQFTLTLGIETPSDGHPAVIIDGKAL